MLFWLHSTTRQHHLHQRLNTLRLGVPVATAARDYATDAGLSPAEAVWWVHGVADTVDGPRRLADLPAPASP